jgi:glycosyltransferase involved in cell wall biosynthesis
MKLLFAYENPLPNAEADAEVFVTTARYLAPHFPGSVLHAPIARDAMAQVGNLARMPLLRARTPLRPAVLRHFFCGFSVVSRHAFRTADAVYTRNLWVAWLAVKFGKQVIFDHYRPWPEQIPPLQYWLYRLFCHERFLGSICHSGYTRDKYLALGVPAEKLRVVHNGFEPGRFAAPLLVAEAKRRLGLPEDSKTVVYTGMINRKKGLELGTEAAKQLPHLTFLLVGSYGEGSIETMARPLENIRIVSWQSGSTLSDYIYAADVLLIPPSLRPLQEFGSTVLPLKLFFYLGAGRPILAGNTPDATEILRHGETAWLCEPDSVPALVEGLRALTEDGGLATALGMAAQIDSLNYTWDARARQIAATIKEWMVLNPNPGRWPAGQTALWARQSRRWLMHFIRTRSPIMPVAPPSAHEPST